jgi:hypothetical protein
MIELFTKLKEEKRKSIKIKSDNVPYWHSDGITELVDYITNNFDKFYVNIFDVEYAVINDIFDDEYVKVFDIEIYMNQETYDYINNNYKRVLQKYDKKIFDISYIKLFNNNER